MRFPVAFPTKIVLEPRERFSEALGFLVAGRTLAGSSSAMTESVRGYTAHVITVRANGRTNHTGEILGGVGVFGPLSCPVATGRQLESPEIIIIDALRVGTDLGGFTPSVCFTLLDYAIAVVALGLADRDGQPVSVITFSVAGDEKHERVLREFGAVRLVAPPAFLLRLAVEHRQAEGGIATSCWWIPPGCVAHSASALLDPSSIPAVREDRQGGNSRQMYLTNAIKWIDTAKSVLILLAEGALVPQWVAPAVERPIALAGAAGQTNSSKSDDAAYAK